VRLMVALCAVAVLGFYPTSAVAQVSLTDWLGRTAMFEKGQVDSNGVNIVFHEAGEGALVVFVHSITGPWFDFRHQLVALSEQYRVVSMSTRGTDESDKPEGVEAYASARIADDINAILNHFGVERATIVGQDSGGLHAWHFAMTYPDRTERLVSLGSIHPAGLIRELVDNPEQQQASTFQRNMQENPEAGARFGERLRGRPTRPDDSPELAELRRAAYERLDADSIVGFYKANWPPSPVTRDTEGFGFTLDTFPPVQAPTLFIYGKNSGPFQNETLSGMWDYIEGPLTIEILPGVGHGPHTEVPEIVTPRILEWLENGH